MATGRWFCQALRNFTPGSSIRLITDGQKAYRWLAEQSGLQVATGHEADGTVLIGMDALRNFAPDQVTGQTLLLFIPFALAEQSGLNALLQRVATTSPIQGHQAVPIGNDQGVLIARCTPLHPSGT